MPKSSGHGIGGMMEFAETDMLARISQEISAPERTGCLASTYS